MKLTWMQIYILIGLFCLALATYWGYQQVLVQESLDQELAKKQEAYQLIKKQCWFKVDWQKTVKCFHLKTPKSTGEFYLPLRLICDSLLHLQLD